MTYNKTSPKRGQLEIAAVSQNIVLLGNKVISEVINVVTFSIPG
jgi:hypothetical protein